MQAIYGLDFIMKIGIAQMALSADIEKNFKRIECFSAEAKRNNVEMVCFPECALTGYYNNLKQIDESQLKYFYNKLSKLSESTCIYLIVGSPYYLNQHRYNSALCFSPDKKIGVYHKQVLTDDDSCFFTSGEKQAVFGIGKYRWGVAVCRDQNSASLFAEYKKSKVDGVLILSAHYYCTEDEARKKQAKNKAIPIVRALDNHLVVCKSNTVGVDNGLISFGGSLIVSEVGYVLKEGNEKEEMMLIATI